MRNDLVGQRKCSNFVGGKGEKISQNEEIIAKFPHFA